MAATLTTTLSYPSRGREVRTYTLAWVSHTDGVVDIDTTMPVVGEIMRVVFIPGSPTPSAAYDVLLKDANGIDVLAGQGANLSETTASHVCPGVALKDGVTTSTRPVWVSGVLNLEVANAGSGKAGSLVIYVR